MLHLKVFRCFERHVTRRCTYVELCTEAAVDAGAEVDEAIVSRDDAFDHLPVYVGEHNVLIR